MNQIPNDPTLIVIAVASIGGIQSSRQTPDEGQASALATRLRFDYDAALSVLYGIPIIDREISVSRVECRLVMMCKDEPVITPQVIIGAIRRYTRQMVAWTDWMTSRSRNICEQAMEFAVDQLVDGGITCDEIDLRQWKTEFPCPLSRFRRR